MGCSLLASKYLVLKSGLNAGDSIIVTTTTLDKEIYSTTIHDEQKIRFGFRFSEMWGGRWQGKSSHFWVVSTRSPRSPLIRGMPNKRTVGIQNERAINTRTKGGTNDPVCFCFLFFYFVWYNFFPSRFLLWQQLHRKYPSKKTWRYFSSDTQVGHHNREWKQVASCFFLMYTTARLDVLSPFHASQWFQNRFLFFFCFCLGFFKFGIHFFDKVLIVDWRTTTSIL